MILLSEPVSLPAGNDNATSLMRSAVIRRLLLGGTTLKDNPEIDDPRLKHRVNTVETVNGIVGAHPV